MRLYDTLQIAFLLVPAIVVILYFFILGVFALDRRAWGEGALFILASLGWWIISAVVSAPVWLPCIHSSCANRPVRWYELLFYACYITVCVMAFLFVRKRFDRREWSK